MPNNNYKIDFDKNTGEFQFYYKEGQGTGPADEPTAVALFKPSDKPFGKFSIDDFLVILNPNELSTILGWDVTTVLDQMSANPRVDTPQNCKYFKLCQEMIVYLDMLKDGFNSETNIRILHKLDLFPTLREFVERLGNRWPQYDSNPKRSVLYRIEDHIYTKISHSMVTQYWKKLKPDGGKDNELNPPFLYHDFMADAGCLGPNTYVKKPGARQNAVTINSFGTYIDSGVIIRGTENNWHENVNDTIIVTQSAMEHYGYTGCSLFAKRVSPNPEPVVGNAKFYFDFTINNGAGCKSTRPLCHLTSDQGDTAYFRGNASKNEQIPTLSKQSQPNKLVKLAKGKSWGDKYQNIIFSLRALLAEHGVTGDAASHRRSGPGGLPEAGAQVVLGTGDNVVAISCRILGNKDFIHTGQSSGRLHGKRDSTCYSATNYKSKPVIEVITDQLNNTLEGIKANNNAIIKFLEDFPPTENFELAGSYTVKFTDAGRLFLDACIADIKDYTDFVDTSRDDLLKLLDEIRSNPAQSGEKIDELNRKIIKLRLENTVHPFFTMLKSNSAIKCTQAALYTAPSNKGKHTRHDESSGLGLVGAKSNLYEFCVKHMEMDRGSVTEKQFQKIKFFEIIGGRGAMTGKFRKKISTDITTGSASRSALSQSQSGGAPEELAKLIGYVPDLNEPESWDTDEYFVSEEINDYIHNRRFEWGQFSEHLGLAAEQAEVVWSGLPARGNKIIEKGLINLVRDDGLQVHDILDADHITYNLEVMLITGLVYWCLSREVPPEKFFDDLYIACIYQGNIDIDNMHDYCPGNVNFFTMLDEIKTVTDPEVARVVDEEVDYAAFAADEAARIVAEAAAAAAPPPPPTLLPPLTPPTPPPAPAPGDRGVSQEDDDDDGGVSQGVPLLLSGAAGGVAAPPLAPARVAAQGVVTGGPDAMSEEKRNLIIKINKTINDKEFSLTDVKELVKLLLEEEEEEEDSAVRHVLLERVARAHDLVQVVAVLAQLEASELEVLLSSLKHKPVPIWSKTVRHDHEAELEEDEPRRKHVPAGGKKTRKNRKTKIRKFSKDKNKKNKKNKKQTKNKKHKKGKTRNLKKPKKTRRRRRN